MGANWRAPMGKPPRNWLFSSGAYGRDSGASGRLDKGWPELISTGVLSQTGVCPAHTNGKTPGKTVLLTRGLHHRQFSSLPAFKPEVLAAIDLTLLFPQIPVDRSPIRV